MASSTSSETVVEKNSILVMDLSGTISERASNDPFSDAFLDLYGQTKNYGLNSILESIKKAKEDDRIKGIYLESGALMGGYATIEEIRNALLDFKESGKFIYSFSSVYTQKAYYLASVSDKVMLTPEGMLDFRGIASEVTFYKGLLEKLGIEMQVFKYGEFKSAVEPFILESLSDANRLQMETFISSLWNQMLKGISISRGLDIETLNQIADDLPVLRDDEYIKASGLIDALVYKDEVLDMLKELTDIEKDKDLKTISISKYTNVTLPDKKKGFEKNKIAIIYAEGEITDGSKDGTGIVAGPLSKEIRKARKDESIKAIVLRVNSPGGSGLASEIIWREVLLAKQEKPVIVSMGDLAASGGYYIACAADTIIAHPNTLTGSIGVFSMIPNISGLRKKIGLTSDIVKTNKMSDMPSFNRPFTAEEKALFQLYTDNFYKTFLQRCADGRNTTVEEINKVGEGRVWSGENAIELNLVDKLGGINDAIETAARMAELDTYKIVELPELESPIDKVLKELTGGAVARIELMMLGEEYQILKTIKHLKSAHPIQARLPYDISVY
ncbi:MAG: signal peptide peptidase SppA [Marinilabiliaceae bacterium]|nr:signal peptide peptidase SppA [Marinilabiliaceae bacterium]